MAKKNFGDVSDQFARTTAPRGLDDDKKRKKWGLPLLNKPDKLGPYIVELNAQHIGGISGAEEAFRKMFLKFTSAERPVAEGKPRRKCMRIAKSYYRCDFSDNEWRALIAQDEKSKLQDRAVYRIWPDFPVSAHTDRSIMTIKADAAVRSFYATGEGITWAVIDSGIQGDHPHFGSSQTEGVHQQHTLLAPEVRDLHRCFIDVLDECSGGSVNIGQYGDPDDLNHSTGQERSKLIEKHRKAALTDEFGHGTHVAGIIAGAAPAKCKRKVLERQFKVDPDGRKIEQWFEERELSDDIHLRGVAYRARLVSLRVLDSNGYGRASQLIQALEYIRERINSNPKLLRVHGVNMSLGYEFDSEMFACGQSPLCTAVDRLVHEGVVVVAASGNTGYGSVSAAVGDTRVALSNTINDPGNSALAITVGATHRDSPHLYGVSFFSSKGPTEDGRLKPDLVAPGERITSCAAGSNLSAAANGTVDESLAYYFDDSGTSMAAAHVSGAIASFLSIRNEFIGRPQEVKRIFLESATPLGRERYFEGNGLVDLMRAIQLV
jgi:subtilisin family serine protease